MAIIANQLIPELQIEHTTASWMLSSDPRRAGATSAHCSLLLLNTTGHGTSKSKIPSLCITTFVSSIFQVVDDQRTDSEIQGRKCLGQLRASWRNVEIQFEVLPWPGLASTTRRYPRPVYCPHYESGKPSVDLFKEDHSHVSKKLHLSCKFCLFNFFALYSLRLMHFR
jgi:hypothetical protein